MENYTWKIGNFATGNIIDSLPLYVIDSPEIDISVDNEDSAEIKILMTPYSDDIKNNWASYFKEVLHFCVAIGEESGDVLWAGMINKITPSISEQTLSFQLVNPKEYTSARIVGEKFGDVVEDPTAGVEITGASYSEIIAELVRRCFAPIDRANTPQPPNILLGALPAKTGEDKKMTFLYSDMLSYAEAIDNAIEESGLDIETRYDAFWANTEKTQVKWQFKCGSETSPHINESSSLSIELRDAENIRKVSEFENLVDSTELFNSFYISSKQGDEEAKNGMDLKNAVNYSSDFPILLETYYSPGVELTETQLNAQLSSYSNQGMNAKRTGSITLELESEDFILWAFNYLGRVITFTGFDNTLSAGYSTALRCVGVRFDLASGRVLIDLMSKQPRYPKLPRKKGKKSKKKTDSKKISPSNKLVKAKDVSKFKSSGGGLPPTPPWNPGGTYPPSDAGPGGQWGTGSETVKDDNNPYEISNYGKIWGEGTPGAMGEYVNQQSWSQNLSNAVVSVFVGQSSNYYWSRTIQGIQTIENSVSNSETSTTPGNPFRIDIGTGYLSDGTLVGYDRYRNSVSGNNFLNDVLLNYSFWGFNMPSSILVSNAPYNFHSLKRLSLGGIRSVIIRDNLFICLRVTLEGRYTNSSGAFASQGHSIEKSIFVRMGMNSWDSFDEMEFLRDASITMGNIDKATRVGDYALFQTNSAIYINNFANYNSISEGNWYTIPLVPSVNGFPITLNYPITIGQLIKPDGMTYSYLVKMGTNKVFGIKLLGGNQPFTVHDDIWEDLSEFFPFPTTAPSPARSMLVDSLSGFLIARIGGSSNESIVEEVYMQDENGVWKKLQTTGTVNSIGNIVFQYGNWVYYTYGANFVSYRQAFHFRKIANWAIQSETSGTALSAKTLSTDEIASNNMVSEGGSSF